MMETRFPLLTRHLLAFLFSRPSSFLFDASEDLRKHAHSLTNYISFQQDEEMTSINHQSIHRSVHPSHSYTQTLIHAYWKDSTRTTKKTPAHTRLMTRTHKFNRMKSMERTRTHGTRLDEICVFVHFDVALPYDALTGKPGGNWGKSKENLEMHR